MLQKSKLSSNHKRHCCKQINIKIYNVKAERVLVYIVCGKKMNDIKCFE